MKLTLTLLAALALAAPCMAAEPDPLAQAHTGKIQCLTPDTKAKTCRSTLAYAFGPGGAIRVSAETAVSETGPIIIMKRQGPIAMKDGALCRTLTTSDIETANFFISGRPATAKEASGLRAEMKTEYAGLIGKELCTRYTADGAGQKATMTVNGAPQPDVTDTAIWIDPKAGYKVSP